MTLILNAVTEDTESSVIEASGPVLISVIGNIGNGLVRVKMNLGTGAGYVTVYRYSGAGSTSARRLELAQGVNYKVSLEGSSGSNTEVTVAVLDVV